jgi:prophage DNA circulation protein
MATIRDSHGGLTLPNGQPNETRAVWRDEWMPARFRTALFHIESGSKDSGRRLVVHEFPKRDLPYSEDMGRRAIEFTVRGYVIVYPKNNAEADILYQRDYRKPRDRLIEALEVEGFGELQLPTLPPMQVAVQRYRVTEENRFGGYAVFDMTFVEQGVPANAGFGLGVEAIKAKSEALRQHVVEKLESASGGKAKMGAVRTPNKYRARSFPGT